ncbi:MAG: type II toxin-antitoxin system mRNA interferase toxin, RelE/StbE family [Proteobacteria bacterium]|nr:type II toxin-antitoxin system mRNA interferase toxin, RelE/StbE family [Pseudomonadota bacterium]MBU1386802.1 type II toxin-antitoxin system mRNA interferase toxin, RelE/StbE family [Pseudomonadota bacterium]MBU1544746.1 type II toxin-antitoxin system mRNA interferase toxin, RelE/StbE family [Pseudomonadota bacterium]MBU2481915.1 type II toxin-antitoxin system mRNA interferase toxin, RelE/StbE family [Pseudomonadota bacterium]
MNEIIINKNARKQLKKLPIHIVRKLQTWAEQVEMLGIEEAKKIKGYHDEPLHGDRTGQRSVRLSKAYTFYTAHDNAIMIEIIEVNKHDY